MEFWSFPHSSCHLTASTRNVHGLEASSMPITRLATAPRATRQNRSKNSAAGPHLSHHWMYAAQPLTNPDRNPRLSMQINLPTCFANYAICEKFYVRWQGCHVDRKWCGGLSDNSFAKVNVRVRQLDLIDGGFFCDEFSGAHDLVWRVYRYRTDDLTIFQIDFAKLFPCLVNSND